EIPMKMSDWIAELDKFASMYGKGVLLDSGKISHKEALEKANKEYQKYQLKTLSPVEKAYLDSIIQVQKTLENKLKKSKDTDNEEI
ncbi:MAG TPA: RhuM family protein, partial [Treponemataceae bacterium]|nr:RhuM family protein [Treponemataceae bacterium]